MPFDTWIGTGRVGGIICCIIAWDLNHLHIWVVMDSFDLAWRSEAFFHRSYIP